MKKTVIGIIIAILVIALGVGAYFMLNSDKEENTNNTNQDLLSSNNEEVNQGTDVNTPDNSGEIVGTETDNTEADNTTSNAKKTLVVYYSAQNHTEAVSEKLAEQLDADLFEIIPEEVYSDADLNWTNKDSRVSREYADESLRDVKLEKDTVDNWDNYDTVLIGYPIWWRNCSLASRYFCKSK